MTKLENIRKPIEKHKEKHEIHNIRQDCDLSEVVRNFDLNKLTIPITEEILKYNNWEDCKESDGQVRWIPPKPNNTSDNDDDYEYIDVWFTPIKKFCAIGSHLVLMYMILNL